MSEVVETKVTKVPAAKSTKVKVQAVRPPFVDLITDTRFETEPVEVEMHPWLQAQIDAGKLRIV